MTKRSTPKGIVVGVDGSSGSMSAVRWAARDAELRNVPLTLVHVVPVTSGHWREASLLPDFVGSHREHGRRVLDDALAVVDEGTHRPTQVDCAMPSSLTVPALVELSKAADLVVAGCLGSGTLRGRHLGSVSAGLVHEAHCPVAVVHDGFAMDTDTAQLPVLVGIDGSPESELATAVAFEEASRRKVELVALHAWKGVNWFDTAVSFGGKGWPALHSVEEEALAERLAGWGERYPDVQVRRLVVRDGPARQLIDQSEGAQLVVVGGHGSGGFAGMVLGSVSAAVVLLSRVPVIVANTKR